MYRCSGVRTNRRREGRLSERGREARVLDPEHVSHAVPQISLVVPVLNEAELIEDALGRLQQFRDRGHELIVVDGGSTDTTEVLAGALADRVLSAARGRATQMNAGAAEARGQCLLFLHADTRLPCQAVAELEQLLSERPDGWGRFDVSFDSSHRALAVIGWFMNLRSRLTGIATGDQAIFVARDLFQRVGGFADIELMEDIALCKRLKRVVRPDCLRSRVVTSGRKWLQEGVLRTVVLMWYLRFRYAFGGDPAHLHRLYYNRGGRVPRPEHGD